MGSATVTFTNAADTMVVDAIMATVDTLIEDLECFQLEVTTGTPFTGTAIGSKNTAEVCVLDGTGKFVLMLD